MDAMDDLSIKAKRKAERRNCYIVLGLVLAILIIFLIVMITRNTLSDPNLYIQELYVPTLNKTTTTTFNTSVFIDLTIKRKAGYSCPFYTYFQMNLYYGENRGMPVAHHMVERFSLGRRKNLLVKAAMEAPTLPWEEASRAVSSGLKVVLMVELLVTRAPEMCNIFSPTKDEGKMEVYAVNVAVDASGHKVSKKPIKLN